MPVRSVLFSCRGPTHAARGSERSCRRPTSDEAPVSRGCLRRGCGGRTGRSGLERKRARRCLRAVGRSTHANMTRWTMLRCSLRGERVTVERVTVEGHFRVVFFSSVFRTSPASERKRSRTLPSQGGRRDSSFVGPRSRPRRGPEGEGARGAEAESWARPTRSERNRGLTARAG